ncbi:hypothetical protein [Sporolituus thermophilus]|uniref:hypothetical protein n=1 Tax=Sporolituus thermophilus TaxID=608505 RepID=UPI00115FEB1B|nr:hypothetical protein [Sporolituus thermophilus]
MANAAEVAGDGREVESLCWTCLRATWRCLCPLPDRVPEDATVARRKVDSLLASLGYREQEYVQAVVSCPKYWPEGERSLNPDEEQGRRSARRKAGGRQWFVFVDD